MRRKFFFFILFSKTLFLLSSSSPVQAKGSLDAFGGEFTVPSYRGSTFLDPKVGFNWAFESSLRFRKGGCCGSDWFACCGCWAREGAQFCRAGLLCQPVAEG